MQQSSSNFIWNKDRRQYRVEINVDQCKPGMEVSGAVYNNAGAVILPDGTILELNIIKSLKRLNISNIKVYIKNENEKSLENSVVFREKYMHNLNVVKEVMHDLYSGKPLNIKKVNIIADSILENDGKTVDIMKNISKIIEVDEYTYTHGLNVSMLSMMVSRWLKFNDKRTEMIVRAGLLHDIGKVKVPWEIINKPEGLLDYEFEEIKKHSKFSEDIVHHVPDIEKEISLGILMHHEREDGSGYPSGLKGDEIHEFAKIIGIVDVFDAITTKRIYKNSATPFDAFEYMEKEGLKKFNKRILMTFLENAANYYKGERFFLNTGEIGEVVFINTEAYSRPIIKIGESFVDLLKNPDIKFLVLV